jgi:hypothetical protein
MPAGHRIENHEPHSPFPRSIRELKSSIIDRQSKRRTLTGKESFFGDEKEGV